MKNAKHTSPVAKDFSTRVRSALAQRGIAIVSSTWLPGADGSYANGERGYCLDDNGTHCVRSYMQIRSMVGDA